MGLGGQKLFGVPIIVQPTMAEKNRWKNNVLTSCGGMLLFGFAILIFTHHSGLQPRHRTWRKLKAPRNSDSHAVKNRVCYCLLTVDKLCALLHPLWGDQFLYTAFSTARSFTFMRLVLYPKTSHRYYSGVASSISAGGVATIWGWWP